ncbi:flavodoxin domain-containing protein [Mesorhizobium xinjiangense]|uniref:flavodoxin domain-containing protein n=1 Tax=Mesorhizobium xinjiangense TaxID=2678685 RepID=UPI0012ED5139|nr:flavodoxin domain-containing protein [Mesorhizobium xinjiangense]
MKICVLYGTETGNAEMLAEDIQSALEDDHDVTCRNLADTDPAALDGETFHVVVCSTYGDGDLPASAQPFADRLEDGAHDLSGVRFAIFGLGDAEYDETFTQGSEKLAAKFKARGATQIGARLTHDASGDDLPEDIALPWITDILANMSVEQEEG